MSITSDVPIEEIRDEAVRRVDAREGYTVEFASDPATHREEYDRETLHVAALACQFPWDQIVSKPSDEYLAKLARRDAERTIAVPTKIDDAEIEAFDRELAIRALDVEIASEQQLDRLRAHHGSAFARSQAETCSRRGCDLPVYADGKCEPCWEIGRDELDAAEGQGRR